ncbi:hypothetical protein G5C51_37585 [Streptomyces sp. A7024]|uniref:Uncharacterized protein n=1 Tax=Streptomyces coryli TaxID=1128680 RepID=A0A6G4UBH6_9ACTN|nr:hypothetical protein [Streptomyces coryli]
MHDVTSLLTAVDQVASRLRALPQSRLRQGAAAEGLALARELTARAQRAEFGAVRYELPDVGEFVVGDQVAVAGIDLAEALRAAPSEEEAARELDEALRLLASAAARI